VGEHADGDRPGQHARNRGRRCGCRIQRLFFNAPAINADLLAFLKAGAKATAA